MIKHANLDLLCISGLFSGILFGLSAGALIAALLNPDVPALPARMIPIFYGSSFMLSQILPELYRRYKETRDE